MTRDQIPKSIHLGGHEIPVKLVKHVPGDEDEHVFGHYDPKTMTIRIRKDLRPSMMEEVFVHEVVEAINDIFELRLAHNKIQTLGVALHQALLCQSSTSETPSPSSKSPSEEASRPSRGSSGAWELDLDSGSDLDDY
jgi:hypothetical protein